MRSTAPQPKPEAFRLPSAITKQAGLLTKVRVDFQRAWTGHALRAGRAHRPKAVAQGSLDGTSRRDRIATAVAPSSCSDCIELKFRKAYKWLSESRPPHSDLRQMFVHVGRVSRDTVTSILYLLRQCLSEACMSAALRLLGCQKAGHVFLGYHLSPWPLAFRTMGRPGT